MATEQTPEKWLRLLIPIRKKSVGLQVTWGVRGGKGLMALEDQTGGKEGVDTTDRGVDNIFPNQGVNM